MAEIEVKVKIDNLPAIKKKLEKLGCTLSEPLHQNDTMYIRKGEKYTEVNEKHIPVLRVRQENEKVILNMKVNRTTELDFIEEEVDINPEEKPNLERMLAHLGYVEALKLAKTRIKCRYKGYEICLDEVKQLGSFIEVEKLSDEEAVKVQEELLSFLSSIEVDISKRTVHGYDTLLLQLDMH
jgi:adenylate cyclase class 2